MHNKKLFKMVVSFALVLALLVPMNMWAFAGDEQDVAFDDEGRCTSVYFGKGTTDSGAYFYGRTEDYSYSWRKVMFVKEAANYAPGTVFYGAETNSSNVSYFTWTYPEKTLRYTICPDSRYNDNVSEARYKEPYGEIGMNEKGVAVTGTVTLNNPRSQITSNSGGRDATVRGGLDEYDTPTLVLMKAETAREGVEILAEICDVKGINGMEGTMISDPNEVWYFQTLSGHQYVGVKCPPDMVGLSPNMTANVGFDGYGGYNGYLDVTDTENVIASPGLISVARLAGTFVGDPQDPDPANPTRIKVSESYVTNSPNHTTNARLRNGYGYLHGLTTQAQINALFPVASKPLDYFVRPRANYKYSLYEAMRMLADTGQGTAWAAAGTSNGQSIGNENTQEAHIVEVRPWLSPELATIEWIAMGPAEFSVYMPILGNLVTDLYDKYYFRDHQSFDQTNIYNNNFWHIFRALHNLSTRGTVTASNTTVTTANKIKYGNGVKDFWAVYQKSIIEQQAKVDAYLAKVLKEEGRTAAEQAATKLSTKLQEDTYEYAVQLITELRAFVAAGAVGNFTPSFSAVPAYAPDNLVFLNLNADEVSYVNDDVCYTVLVSNATDVLAVELDFSIDGSMLAGKGLEGLNDFESMNGILWTYAGDGLWKGTVTLALPSGSTTGLTSEAPVDIAKFFYAANGFGNAVMALTSARVVGLYDDTTRYLMPIIENGTATTVIARSKYDLNRDGVVDALDLGIMLLYCGFDADSPNWGALVKVNDAWGNGVTASMCDVNGDGLIDMLDLLDLFIHYTK
ncbi:MAG: C69 family dipeptidase [Clostridiales bacterium]|nr:C69 family dipeptidase [Clostridiales bacterium]